MATGGVGSDANSYLAGPTRILDFIAFSHSALASAEVTGSLRVAKAIQSKVTSIEFFSSPGTVANSTLKPVALDSVI